MPDRSRPHVVVVGAGITGACIAWHLARDGASVTLIEGDRPAGGVTSRSFAWINTAHELECPHAGLRRTAVAEYQRMEAELEGAITVQWCGALSWQASPEATEAFIDAQCRAGQEVSALHGHAVTEREPALRAPPPLAAWSPREGAIDPVAVTRALVAAACATGRARLVTESATGVLVRGERVRGVHTATRAVEADAVVLATGTATPSLCHSIGVPVAIGASPAVLLELDASDLRLGTILSTPEIEIRPAGPGRLLVAEDYVEGRDHDAIAGDVRAALSRNLHGGESASIRNLHVGQRPMPVDGAPIVGFVAEAPGLYLAVMHAAITLAPLIGRLAAAEITGAPASPDLEHCRPGRAGLR